MGAGKSRVGRLVAERLDWPFADLDQRIETAAGMKVAEVFSRWGETYFRDLEHTCLATTEYDRCAVIATGGGTMATERNRRILRRLGKSLWLDVPFDVILGRLSETARQLRPLFRDEAKARRLYRERLAAYASSDLKVAVQEGDQATDVAAKILDLLRATSCDT